VFGRKIQPGQLIHADKHGFLAVPKEDEDRLLEASKFMDENECNTVIAAARNCAGLDSKTALQKLNDAAGEFGAATREKFKRDGEW
jgi:regulator of RNase E activity RraA